MQFLEKRAASASHQKADAARCRFCGNVQGWQVTQKSLQIGQDLHTRRGRVHNSLRRACRSDKFPNMDSWLVGKTPGSTSGPIITEMRLCVMEGHLGVDVIARSEQHPHVFVWVNAHTKEVQHCRQVAAVDTAMLAQIQVCEMLPSERLPSATSVSLKSHG